MATNFWFEHHIDAYLVACAEGRDWVEAIAAAERAIGESPRRVLTRAGLKAKGISYSRQYLIDKVSDGTFPRPFQMPISDNARHRTRRPSSRAKWKCESGRQW